MTCHLGLPLVESADGRSGASSETILLPCGGSERPIAPMRSFPASTDCDQAYFDHRCNQARPVPCVSAPHPADSGLNGNGSAKETASAPAQWNCGKSATAASAPPGDARQADNARHAATGLPPTYGLPVQRGLGEPGAPILGVSQVWAPWALQRGCNAGCTQRRDAPVQDM